MASSDFETLNKNAFLFIYLRVDSEKKRLKIESLLQDGADVNAVDKNFGCNTPLHTAVMMGDLDVAQVLTARGANLHAKNTAGKTPLDLARESTRPAGKQILDFLNSTLKTSTTQNKTVAAKPDAAKAKPKTAGGKSKKGKFKYTKRDGTSGVHGQLYETKLLSLVLLRALNNKRVEKFELGTNIAKVGALDDICLRYKLKGKDKHTLVGLQAKHREDPEKGRVSLESVRNEEGDFSYVKYFESYLMIKGSCKPGNVDPMFDGEFSELDCNFIIYTSAKENFAKKSVDENNLCEEVRELFQTGGEMFQFKYEEIDVVNLTKMTVLDRVKALGSALQAVIATDKSESMMSNVIFARFHYLLARDVIQITQVEDNRTQKNTTNKNQQDNAKPKEIKQRHIGMLRPDFYTNTSIYFECLKDALYKEISVTRWDKSPLADNEVATAFASIFQNVSSQNISKVIGKTAIYKEDDQIFEIIETKDVKKQLEDKTQQPIHKRLNEIKEKLLQTKVPPKIVREAVLIKLQSKTFPLHPIFGNLDMAFRGDEDKQKQKIKDVTTKLMKLLNHFKSTKLVKINEKTVGDGDDKITPLAVFDTNGGMGSAVGNLLIQDNITKLFKFNLSTNLPKRAQMFLDALLQLISKEELSEYRIEINLSHFPKYNFEGDEYDKREAREFLSKLWFFSSQAKENAVENILKSEINKYYNNDNRNPYTFKIQTDAIYLRSHDNLQKWWLEVGEAGYLDTTCEFFEQAKNEVVDSPLLTILNLMYISKIKSVDLAFTQTAVNNLRLQDETNKLLNVVSESVILSGIKLMQYFEFTDNCTFIDFDYILSLPFNDGDLFRELKETKTDNLVIIYNSIKYDQMFCAKLNQIIETFKGSRAIVVVSKYIDENMQKYFQDKFKTITDYEICLANFNDTSQKKILTETKLNFQNVELPMNTLLDKGGIEIVKTGILNKILNADKIEIGKQLIDQKYKDTKDYYVERYLSRDDEYLVNSLEDVRENMVVISSKSGMGKSLLLTHVAMKTKEDDPSLWIVRINLPEYEKYFTKWQAEKTEIGPIVVFDFLCKIALLNWDDKLNVHFEEDSNKIMVSSIEGTPTPVALFELDLFVYLYNNDKVAFLFDDFNAISPTYEVEVMAILKTLRSCNKRTWVTTCSYFHTKRPLETEFENVYTLQPLNARAQKSFVYRFLKTNAGLEKLNYDQYENVSVFLRKLSKYIKISSFTDPDRGVVPIISVLCNLIYVVIADIFKSEINKMTPSLVNDKLRQKFEIDFNRYTPIDELLGRARDEELELADTPLHIYILANYFKCCIEDVISFVMDESEALKKVDLITKVLTMYQYYAQDQIKKMCNREIDASDDDAVTDMFRTTRKHFFEKYNKLWLFTLCRERDSSKLINEQELKDVQNIIANMNTGIANNMTDCMVNGIPRSAHLVFAEYFAVDCLTSLMKQAVAGSISNPFTNTSTWNMILNMLLFHASPGIRNAFNYKLRSDPSLANATSSDMCQKVVFELLFSRDGRDGSPESSAETVILDALEDKLYAVVNLYLSSAQSNLTRGDVAQMETLLRRSGSMFTDFASEYKEQWGHFLESLRRFDVQKFGDILKKGTLTEVPLRHAYNYCNSPTAKELTAQVVAVAEEVPAIGDSVQRVLQQAELLASTAAGALGQGLAGLLDGIMHRLQEDQDPQPSTSSQH